MEPIRTPLHRAVAALTTTSTASPTPPAHSSRIAANLEARGWRADVAGADCQPVVKAVLDLLRDPTRQLGLLVTGAVGCGKTTLLRALRQMMARCEWYECANPDHLAHMDIRATDRAVLEYVLGSSVIIDDLGREQTTRNYGTVQETVGDFIAAYTERGRGRLIVSTNLNAEQIAARYGMRVLDRLLGACIVLPMSGGSHRACDVRKNVNQMK